MPFDINITYPVNTPPLVPEKLQGMRITQSAAQFKFSNFEGMAGDDVITIKTGETKTGIESGVFVTAVSNALGDLTFKKLTAASDKIYGFTFLNFQRALLWSESLHCFFYQKGDEVTLVTEGDYVGYSEKPVETLDPVYQRIAVDGTNTRIGALSNAAGTGLMLIPGAKFIEKISAPGRADITLQDLY